MTQQQNTRAVAPRPQTAVGQRPETIADILLDRGRALTALKAQFPKDLTNEGAARQFLALCLSYDLDPFQKEIVPFQGTPYVTDAGWLKLVLSEAPGQLVGEPDTRLCTDHEKGVLGLGPTDYLAECTVERKWPNGETLKVTRRGVVREKEWTEAREFLPVANEPWEMAEKRARVRALRTAFRDVLQLRPAQFAAADREEAFDGPPALEVAPPAVVAQENAQAAEKTARGAFHAAATELGLVTQEAVHRLMEVPCRGRVHGNAKAPDACHALRELVDAWVKAGDSEDAAWERARERLLSNHEKRLALGTPDGEPDTVEGQAAMLPEGAE